jgi:hypothetical protein
MKKFTNLENELIKENLAAAARFDFHYKNVLKKLDQIKIGADDMAIDAKNVNWGHVGSMEHISEELDNILEFLGVKETIAASEKYNT